MSFMSYTIYSSYSSMEHCSLSLAAKVSASFTVKYLNTMSSCIT